MLSRLRISPKSAVAGACLILAACAATAHAQVQTARVSTKDSVRITVVSTRKVDTLYRTRTVTKTDTLVVTKCYDAQKVAILCPAAVPAPSPQPAPSPTPIPAPVDTTPRDTSSHEPAGMTLIAERAWNRLGEWGYDQLEDAQLASKYRIVQDPSAPKSPPNVAQFIYPAGFTSVGASPAVAETGLRGRVVYVSVWMMVSANWYGHETGVLKTLHFWTGNVNKVIPEIYGERSGPLQLCVMTQGIVSGTANNCPPAGQGIFTRGVWHRCEFILTGNTSGAKDGRLEAWLDGVKVGDYAGFQFNSGATTWDLLQANGTWGGSGGPTVPALQTWSVDHIVLKSKP